MNKALFITAASLLWTTSIQAQDVDWKLDKNHSRVGFVARHLAFAKVRGQFQKFTAKVRADVKTGKLSSFQATLEASSIDTDNARRDKHLRSDDFFAADKHPTITIKSKSFKWKGNKFTATVALTIRGITRDVKFEGELLGMRMVNFGRGAHPRAAFEARATIDRTKFGLK
ncbi:MAG: YceI family protein, partial [Chloroflexi bacterium]|nr:YceI family protein [Chloroflexota bacterium]